MWKAESKPCNSVHFLGIYMLLRVLYYVEEQEVYLLEVLWDCFAVLYYCKNLSPWGLVRSSHAFRGECGSSGTKDMLVISQMQEIGMATSKHFV